MSSFIVPLQLFSQRLNRKNILQKVPVPLLDQLVCPPFESEAVKRQPAKTVAKSSISSVSAVEGTSVTPRQRPKRTVAATGIPPPLIGASPTPSRTLPTTVSPPPATPLQPPAPPVRHNSEESAETLFPPSGQLQFCALFTRACKAI